MLWKVNYSDIVFINTVCIRFRRRSKRAANLPTNKTAPSDLENPSR